MTRRMYDSTTIADIPESATMIASYVDGRYANHDEAHKRFPHAIHVSITVNGSKPAQVVDCEAGDLTPAHAAAWAAFQIDAGRHPTIYTYAAQWPAVKAEVKKLQLRPDALSYWIADYDGDPTIPAGAVAKQYANPDLTGHHFDRSSVAAHWPGVDPESAPEPTPNPHVPADPDVRRARRLLRRALRLLAKGKKNDHR